MQINTKSIKSRFEKSMDKYDENAVVQIDLACKLVNCLTSIQNEFDTILELGAGTGVLTKYIKNSLKFKQYTGNDLVEKSKNYISKIIKNSEFIQGNALKIKPAHKADLIISNAMFQWFSDITDITEYAKKLLNADGILAFSTFGKDNFKEIKDLSGLTLNYLTLDEIQEKLSKDYEILHIEDYTHTLDFQTPLELLLHMKNTGVNSLSAKPWTIKEIKDFCEKYMNKYNKVQLTYNPIIVIAKTK